MTSPASPVKISTPEELSRFIDSLRPQLLSWIERSLGPALKGKVEPDDLFQEMALSAVAGLEHFQVSGRDPFRLLCQMAEQRIIDAHRFHVEAKKRAIGREVPLSGQASSQEGNGFLDLLVASITSPSAAFSKNQKELRLQLALQELSDEQRTAIRLRYVEGLATRDIAEQLQKSDGAIRVLLTRTIALLQERLMSID
ncbi:MAG: sigma-70 family RNA polymerase sigma factor [Planctomycetaceae bacterium]|nr:sigma-70 family RNA polymerase sigma factor [Planctomycetaceae bacterium]